VLVSQPSRIAAPTGSSVALRRATTRAHDASPSSDRDGVHHWSARCCSAIARRVVKCRRDSELSDLPLALPYALETSFMRSSKKQHAKLQAESVANRHWVCACHIECHRYASLRQPGRTGVVRADDRAYSVVVVGCYAASRVVGQCAAYGVVIA